MSPVSRLRIKGEPIDWTNLSFIGGYHVLLLILLPLYLASNLPSLELLAVTVFLTGGCLLSITTGYHRLYAHKTYRTRRVVESVLLFFGTLATEGSALKWSHDHRLHHRHVDTDRDPYGTPIGFWHSHMLWMFKQPAPWDNRLVRDLETNLLLRIQSKYYGLWVAVTNILVVFLTWFVVGDLFGTIVFALLARLFIVHHSTWFINSLAHMWGSKPYSTEHSAVNNFILSLLTYGEGYHNYHHTFAGDYRNGIRWFHFDPPKYIIWAMSKIGLATRLKRVDRLTIKRKLVSADRKLMLAHLDLVARIDTEPIREMIDRMFDPLSKNLVGLKISTEKYREIRKRGSEEVAHVRGVLKSNRQRVSQEMDEWAELVRFVLTLRPQLVL